MKIVIFINNLSGGGAERVTATLANYWARKQWDVTIVTLGSQELDFYSLDASIRRIALDLSQDSADVLEALRNNLRRVRALRQTLKTLKPQVALSMMSTSNVLMALASRGMDNLCAVGSERCYPPHFPLGRLWHLMRRRMYGSLSAIVALTEECGDWIKMHSSAKCVPVIPNAACWPLPDNLPRIAPDTVCASERRMLLAVGRLSHEKNFAVLVAVFSELSRLHPGWDLVILGEGPERQQLEQQIDESALATRVFMPGIAGNVGQWYTRADVFVMTSRFEGFPNALAEALAHGLPAVSFDCDTGPRDIVRHGIDGLLVPPGDVSTLRASLDLLMRSHHARERMALRAIEARSRFSIEKVAGMWEDLFDDLCGTTIATAAHHAKTAGEKCHP